jgi:hypothetical protein
MPTIAPGRYALALDPAMVITPGAAAWRGLRWRHIERPAGPTPEHVCPCKTPKNVGNRRIYNLDDPSAEFGLIRVKMLVVSYQPGVVLWAGKCQACATVYWYCDWI